MPLPLSDGSPSTGPVVIEGQAPPPPNEGIKVEYSVVGTEFFKTVATPIVQGRDFTDHDRDGTPAVVIINQEMARRLFDGESNAIGRRFTAGDSSSPVLEVIGVAKDGRYRSLGENPQPYMFLPELQKSYSSRMTLLLRGTAGARMENVVIAARREIQTMDGRLPIFGVMPAEEHLSYVLWGPRMSAGMATALGLLGLLLATIGLYAMVAHSVSQRMREIGVRIALGARKMDILKLIISQGMILVLIGIAGGLAGAFALGRLLGDFLNGVSGTDPFVAGGVALLLALAAFAGCYLPARRALEVDPIITLKSE
jgi:predicted permease